MNILVYEFVAILLQHYIDVSITCVVATDIKLWNFWLVDSGIMPIFKIIKMM